MKTARMIRTRAFAVLAMLLMAISLMGGVMPGQRGAMLCPAYASGTGSGTGTPAASGGSGTVNDLWDTVTSTGVGGALNSSTTNLDTVITKAQSIAKTITSILTIISFVSLLFWVTKLALSAGNPRERTTAITGILVSGIALALFGGAWVVVSFFWNLLN